MLQYVDAFSCALNEGSHSIVIHFNQTEPIVNNSENGEAKITTITNNVVSLIMDLSCAQELSRVVNQLFESHSTTNNDLSK